MRLSPQRRRDPWFPFGAFADAMSVLSSSVWGYGIASVIIISLAAGLGIVMVPCMSKSAYGYLLSFLVSLGVGTLTGDAVMHLIPHLLNVELHGSFNSQFGLMIGILAGKSCF